ncbi:MAG: hypothetical protein ABF289_07010 [Clostridiales bacterium]
MKLFINEKNSSIIGFLLIMFGIILSTFIAPLGVIIAILGGFFIGHGVD